MIKTFKDFILEDLDVFFNDEEFGDEHELDGETLIAIAVDNSINNDSKGLSKEQHYASQEVYKKTKTVYVKSADFYIPKVDSTISLDGESYYVDEANEHNGIIKILLSANES